MGPDVERPVPEGGLAGVLARVGQWCFAHRWPVVGVWIAVMALGVLSAGVVFGGLVEDNNPRNVESIQGSDILEDHTDTGGTVVGYVDRIDAGTAAVRDALGRVSSDLAALPTVASVQTPDAADGSQPLLGPGHDAALILVTLKPFDAVDRETVLRPITDRLRSADADLAAAGAPSARIRVGGQPVLQDQISETRMGDLSRSELISLPITLIVLIIIFGGLAAAGLPLLAAIASAITAMIVLLGFALFTDLDHNTVTVVTLLGLGLSVDYGLLLVTRYREEVSRGWSPGHAIGRTWATAGHTVLFSGLTIAVALGGLLTFDISMMAALSAAGMSIAVVAVCTALTFTAAMLGLARRWVAPSKRAILRQALLSDATDVGFFSRLGGLVQRRPALVIAGTVAVLAVLASPLLIAKVTIPEAAGVPRSIEAMRVQDDLASTFGEQYAPAVRVVAEGGRASLDVWADRWRQDTAVAAVLPAEAVGDARSTVVLTLRGAAQDAAAQDLVARVRADRPEGRRSWVTGEAAVLIDLRGKVADRLPLALAVTMIAMLVLLFAMTGSLIVPIKAIMANILSLGATFGVLVLVFQEGYGQDVLNTLTIGGLSPFVLVIVFAFAFGLSMDYEVFLLGRVKEYVDQGVETDAAVRHGLQRTGRVITSAAILMMVVFGCFGSAETGNIEQIGIGLTMAVLIDATLVRCLLVPATMTLLGRWNWWAPAGLASLRRGQTRAAAAERPSGDRCAVG